MARKIESIVIKRAESLSEDAKKRFDVANGFVKIITTRGSPATTTVEKLDNAPATVFRDIMKK